MNMLRITASQNLFNGQPVKKPFSERKRYLAVGKLTEPNLCLRDSLIVDNLNRLLTLKVNNWLIMIKAI